MTTDLEIERIFREEHGRVVASLIRRFGDIDVAEDAAAEALLAAVERWPVDGVPPNPGGWLTTTAVRKGIDKIRRESHRDAKYQQALMIADDTPHAPTGPVEDDRLRLIFTCCHPALAPEARVALTLRLLGGLTVPEIASAFLVSETTMGQRITRAKKKIAAANIPYRVPAAEDLPGRLTGVLAVLYLVFNEGYLATSGPDPMRVDLTAEAIRLGRLLRSLLPTEPEVAGLLALMLLTDARRTARFADGVLVPLTEQDRASWDPAEIEEGLALVRECLAVNRPGAYQIQAAVNAVHTSARTARRHRLVPDRGAVRPAARHHPVARRRPQPRRRPLRARRPRRRPRRGRPPRPPDVPPLALHPRRAAPPPRPPRRRPGRVRRRPRPHRQRRRARLPHPPPRRAVRAARGSPVEPGIAPTSAWLKLLPWK